MIAYHKMLIEDKARCEAFRRAIHQIVKRGDTVADIGTGSGLLAYFALLAGASKVYAIEKGTIIEDAKKVAMANSFAEKIDFIKGLSTEVNLPEKVDVVVSELLGPFALEENIVKYLVDAKTRFLKKGGKMIPFLIEMHIAPVEAPEIYKDTVEFWDNNLYGINFADARLSATNRRFLQSITPEEILAKGVKLHTLDLVAPKVSGKIDIDAKATFKVARKSVMHGLCGWFCTELSNNNWLSNEPQSNATSWKNVFFPIETPLALAQGDNVTVRMIIQSFYGRIVWTWIVETDKERFKHSTFKGLSFSKDWLLRRRLGDNFIPALKQEDKIRCLILNSCNGTASTKEIASKVFAQFPDAFQSADEALDRVLIETQRCKVLPL